MSDYIRTTACVVGGGPAGLMTGLLLARAGVETVVLEKHSDFLRDFRGDTIHPSTLELINELGWLDEFLKIPHERLARLMVSAGDERLAIADFSHLKVQAPFIAMMPQWDFLNFLAEKASAYSTFRLLQNAEVTDLTKQGDKVTGVVVKHEGRELNIRSDLVIGADGRGSKVRECSGLQVDDIGAPMDVLWFRIPRQPGDASDTGFCFAPGAMLVTINRGSYWQCAFIIPKGSANKVRAKGLEAFRSEIARTMQIDITRLDVIDNFDKVKLLEVQVNRMPTWHRPGLLCIGDSAHAMSPVGGVGVNLAVQDAVATANLLAPALKAGTLTNRDLAKVQARRMFPVRATQMMQLAIQNKVIAPALTDTDHVSIPYVMRLLACLPLLQRLPGRAIGLGARPEHISRVAA